MRVATGPSLDLRVVRLAGEGTLELTPPEPAFTVGAPYYFDVAPDGRFLVATVANPDEARNFRLTLNWPGLLGS
jgi:hypothetical protein